MTASTDLAGILISDHALRLFNTWRSLCREGRAPGWSDFDPASVPDVLRFLAVLRPGPEKQLTISIFGTELREVLDREITGLDALDDIPGIEHFQLREMLSTVRRGRQAFITLRNVYPKDRPATQLQAMCLPTLDADGNIARMISAFIPVRAKEERLADILEGGRARMDMAAMIRYDIATDSFSAAQTA